MEEGSLDPAMTSRSTEKKNVSVAKNVGSKSLLAFWILGVCNNMGYVVMLSAAHDILGGEKSKTDNPRECNTMSTGAILLADIVPSLFVKIVSPFFPLHEHIRMVVVTVSAAVAFCMVGYASATNVLWLAYAGVALTSFTSGLGEATLLSFMSFYGDKNVITAWGSGTGGAGFLGAFYYAAMVGIGLSSTVTLYTLISIPLLMAISFWILLDRPNISGSASSNTAAPQGGEPAESYQNSVRKIEEDADSSAYLVPTVRSTHTFSERVTILPKLVKYMIPLGLVYFFEYLINQGLFELLYFRNIWLAHDHQYRWYQVLYQVGVFISRSSLTFVKFNQLWLFAVLQCCNLVYLYFDSVYSLSPTIFIVFGFILFEGLLGGAAYVNTYYKIDTEMPIEEREFSMSMTSFADALGICLAGLSAIPLHNYICGLPLSSKASS